MVFGAAVLLVIGLSSVAAAHTRRASDRREDKKICAEKTEKSAKSDKDGAKKECDGSRKDGKSSEGKRSEGKSQSGRSEDKQGKTAEHKSTEKQGRSRDKGIQPAPMPEVDPVR